MKCRTLVRQLPAEWRKRLDADAAFAPHRARGNSLLKCLTCPQVLEEVWKAMSEWEREALRSVIRNVCGWRWDERDLAEIARKEGMPLAFLQAGLLGLRQKAIVFLMKKPWGDAVYVMPADTFGIWHRLCLADNISHKDSGVPQEISDESPAGRSDIPSGKPLPFRKTQSPSSKKGAGLFLNAWHAAVYLSHNGLRITRKGTFHQNQVKALTGMLDVQEDAFPEAVRKKTAGGDEPWPFSVILAVLSRGDCWNKTGGKRR